MQLAPQGPWHLVEGTIAKRGIGCCLADKNITKYLSMVKLRWDKNGNRIGKVKFKGRLMSMVSLLMRLSHIANYKLQIVYILRLFLKVWPWMTKIFQETQKSTCRPKSATQKSSSCNYAAPPNCFVNMQRLFLTSVFWAEIYLKGLHCVS